MKPWFYPTLAVLGVIFLLLAAFFSIMTYYVGPTIRIGTIDVQKVTTDSQLGKEFRNDILAKRNEIGAKIKKAQQDNDEQAAMNLNNEFNQYVENKHNEFADLMNKKVAELAKKRKIVAVFPGNLVNYAGKAVDITDDVINALE